MPQSLSHVIVHLVFRLAFLAKYAVEFDERYVWD